MLRDATPTDWPAVLALNEDSVAVLSPLDEARLSKLAAASCYFKVWEHESKVAAFLLAFRKGADYDSVNFRWFDSRPGDFVYIDRIVIAPSARGQGLAHAFYDDLESFARAHHINRVTAEIDIVPPNPVSLAFHDARGFREIGQQPLAGGKTVSLREAVLVQS